MNLKTLLKVFVTLSYVQYEYLFNSAITQLIKGFRVLSLVEAQVLFQL